jgi:hypothetical protein
MGISKSSVVYITLIRNVYDVIVQIDGGRILTVSAEILPIAAILSDSVMSLRGTLLLFFAASVCKYVTSPNTTSL